MINRQQIADLVDKAYPGLLDEHGRQIEVIAFKGAIQATFIQAPDLTILDSAALRDVANKEGTYQSVVTPTQGVQRRKIGSKTFVSTSNESAFVFQTRSTFPEYPISTKSYPVAASAGFASNGWNQLSETLMTAPRVKSLDESLVQSSDDTAWDQIFQRPQVQEGYQVLLDYVASLGVTPQLGIFIGGANGTTGGEAWTGSIAGEMTRNVNSHGFPCVPGYTRVTFRQSSEHTGSGGTNQIIYTTYIPGRADIAHDFGNIPYLSGSYRNISFGIVYETKYSTNPDKPSVTRFDKNVIDGGFLIPVAELDRMCKVDAVNMNMYTAPSVMLFGPPKVKFYADGSEVVNEVIEDDTDPRDWTLQYIEIDIAEYLWVVDKEWYSEYMNTGFHVFTPRNSNIRENVLKQWSDLEYHILTVRGTSEAFETNLDVNKLPEAVDYAKGRAKACKDNDWLKQIAIPGTTVTWAGVDQKEKAQRPRSVWMNNVAFAPTANIAKVVREPTVVSYVIVNGITTRTEGEVSYTIDKTNEEHQEIVTFDRYFNSGASVTGGTWDDIVLLEESEKQALTESVGEYTSEPGFDGGKVVGFSTWIDPTGCSDIASLTEMQKYRLHIKNSLFFDSMSAPLKRVLESFGYETLVRFAAKL